MTLSYNLMSMFAPMFGLTDCSSILVRAAPFASTLSRVFFNIESSMPFMDCVPDNKTLVLLNGVIFIDYLLSYSSYS